MPKKRIKKPLVFRSRLFLKLAAVVVAAVAAALGVYAVTNDYCVTRIDDMLISDGYRESMSREGTARLQSYVDANGVTVQSLALLDDWSADERYMYYILYKNGSVIYDSDMRSTGDYAEVYYDKQTDFSDCDTVTMADGEALFVYMSCYDGYKYYTLATAGCAAAAFIVFLLLLMLFLRGKLRYISLLASELKVLEGGDLGYAVTVKGKDELGDLARDIDNMRISILERSESEENARLAANELVTAMSHDLRTPLTSLIGYLDIIEGEKVTDGAELARYAGCARAKAYQLKEMTDRLFACSYGQAAESFETLSGRLLLEQILEEDCFELERSGFEVDYVLPQEDFEMTADPVLMRRVFDNLRANILRHGDASAPVRAVVSAAAGRAEITVTNRALEADTGGTGVGSRSCRAIFALHGGGFETEYDDGMYTVRITLPARMI